MLIFFNFSESILSTNELSSSTLASTELEVIDSSETSPTTIKFIEQTKAVTPLQSNSPPQVSPVHQTHLSHTVLLPGLKN